MIIKFLINPSASKVWGYLATINAVLIAKYFNDPSVVISSITSIAVLFANREMQRRKIAAVGLTLDDPVVIITSSKLWTFLALAIAGNLSITMNAPLIYTSLMPVLVGILAGREYNQRKRMETAAASGGTNGTIQDSADRSTRGGGSGAGRVAVPPPPESGRG